MVTTNNESTATSDREIVASRVITAPRELVWDRLTQPEHIARWWKPNGFTNTIHKMDVRPGGVWQFVMHGPDYDNEIVYVEVVRPERLVYTHLLPRFDTTVTFEDEGGKTTLTMRQLFETPNDYEVAVKQFGAIEGAKQHLSRLAESLAGVARS